MIQILPYLTTQLRAVGVHGLEEVARRANEAAGANVVSVSTLTKLMYGDRKNPRLTTVQALLDVFASAHGASPSRRPRRGRKAAVKG